MTHPPRNSDYQTVWEEFVKEYRDRRANVLLPIEIGLMADPKKPGQIIIHRDRMTSREVAKIWKGIKKKFPKYVTELPDVNGNAPQIFTDYISYFDTIDFVDNPPSRTPLDLKIIHPTWMMYVLDTENIKFAKNGAAYSVENDSDNLCRNFEMIAMFDDPRQPSKRVHGEPIKTRKILILANRNRSAPKGLKFNLHVDILQTLKVDGKRRKMSTTVIIDPGGDNRPRPPYPEDG